MSGLNAEFPHKLQFLFEPHRYKVLYGGRVSGKSWSVARALLIMGGQRPLRILCTRELQNSISESVIKTLADNIVNLGAEDFYQVQNNGIRGRNGTEFTMRGLRHNVAALKSFEGVDIAWVEEAANVSKHSWDTLIPTIRKEGSEIWVTFNPELDTDETYKRFVLNTPTDAVVMRMNWNENPWFSETMRKEMLDLKAMDPDSWLTIYEGHCRQTLDGAIYAKEVRSATEEGRITSVPYDASLPVHTFWDLGWADNTSIWFAQVVGFEYHIIDYIEGSQQPLTSYLQQLQQKPYVYGTDWIPHDGQSKQLGTGRSIEEMMRAAGRKVQVVPKLSVTDGINAARTIFGQCWFDASKCTDGLQCLRRYRYDVDQESGAFSRTPLHDSASHGADAFRMLAIALRGQKKAREFKPVFLPPISAQGWMGR